jgi:Domain of unknown function (DUF4352)
MPRVRLWRVGSTSPTRPSRIARLSPLAPSAVIAIVVVALAFATVGVGRLAVSFGHSEPQAVGRLASISDLTAQVTAVEWARMDHDMSSDAPGYQMPPAMMPGMPTGDDQRLSIDVVITNTSDETRRLRPAEEFVLHTGNGKQWALHSDTFGDLSRLAPHNAVNGILFFDLPPTELNVSSAWVEWTNGGTTAKLAISQDGAELETPHPHT